MSKPSVWLISPRNQFSSHLEQILEEEPIQIHRAARWEEAEATQSTESKAPHLIILTCASTGVDGLMVCQEIRKVYAGLLVVISENGDERFYRLSLDLGADAALPVSTGAPLAAANVKALLRRFGPASAPAVLNFGSLTVDANRRDAYVADRAAHLSSIEFRLIWYLAQKPGSVVTRDEIYRELHSAAYNGYDRRIDVYMSRIRQKIGDDPASPSYLKTVRGVGYQLMAG